MPIGGWTNYSSKGFIGTAKHGLHKKRKRKGRYYRKQASGRKAWRDSHAYVGWNRIGQRVSGRLVFTETKTTNPAWGPTTYYHINGTAETSKGKRNQTSIIRGTLQINERLKDVQQGNWVSIRYLGEVQTQNGHAMKNFDVAVFGDRQVIFSKNN